jgi:hypothetical protein
VAGKDPQEEPAILSYDFPAGLESTSRDKVFIKVFTMSSFSRLESIYKDLEKEHERVMSLLARLRENVDAAKLLSLLDELRSLLIAHFSREQRPQGFYDTLGELAGSRRDELQALIVEHGSIISHLDETLEHAKDLPVVDGTDLLARVSKLLETLHDHEEKEHLFAVDVLRANSGTS